MADSSKTEIDPEQEVTTLINVVTVEPENQSRLATGCAISKRSPGYRNGS